MKNPFKKSIRNRILFGILSVPALSVLIFIPWSLNFIDETALKQAQDKVELDLNTGRYIYNEHLHHLSTLVSHHAIRPTIIGEIQQRKTVNLKKALDKIRNLEKRLDILLITDNSGRVLVRSGDSGNINDDLASDNLISQALKGKSVHATDILPPERLLLEGNNLAERARVKILSTPFASEKIRSQFLENGMVLAAAQPIIRDGQIIGVFYTAQLINRNFSIVDETRDTVYRNRLYKGKMVGTSTIFQGELRVSTNVLSKDGERAIGTCISDVVGRTCLDEGRRFIGRAFVVDDWYITAYEPIYDIDRKVIGVLYVGTLESPYVGLKRDLFAQILLFILGITPFGVAISVFVSKKIVKPLKELASATEKIAEGDYSKRVLESEGEVGILASSFNRMAESVQTKTEALNEAQKSLYNYSKNLEKLVKERTEKLLATEMRYVNLFEIANDALFTVDKSYLFTSVNRYGEQLTGYTRAEIVGKIHFVEFVHPDDREQVKEKIDSVLNGQVSSTGLSFSMLDRAGTRRIIEMNASVLKGNEDATELLGIARDVTERRGLEEEIARTRDELQILFNSITDGINVVDRDYHMIKANEGMAKQRGLPVEAMIGRKCYEVFYERNEPCENCLVEETFRTGRPSFKTRERLRKDGTSVSADVFTFPILDKNNQVIQVVEYSRDVTERNRLEQQLLRAQKMESIGVLAGGIAHDFNNLLSGILGYSSLLKARIEPSDSLHRYADTIEQSAIKAARLTQQLLTFSRGSKSRTEKINLNSILEETLQILERTFDKNIVIKRKLSPDLWHIEADPSQMEQVVLNVCINARDAMSGGGTLDLQTSNLILESGKSADLLGIIPGKYVKLSIRDSGMGIAKTIQDKIFDPFFTTKDKTKGTGLGLSVVYGIVKNHGGQVHFDSEPGRGTIFDIYLPASDHVGVIKDSDISPKNPFCGHEKILLVDDEEVVRDLGREVLERNGYKVLLASDGAEAVDIYKKRNNEIDIIILDMIMPNVSGAEAFESFQTINPKVKVIVSSGYSSEGHYQAVFKKGAKGFIQKPYRIEELTKMIREVLDGHGHNTAA